MLTSDRPRSPSGPTGALSGGGATGRPGGGPTGWSWGLRAVGGDPAGAGRSDGPASWALAVSVLASASGLFRVFSGWSWAGRVVATVAVAELAMWALRRWRVRQTGALPLALAVVAVMVVWTVFGSDTVYGWPGGAVWSHMGRAIGGLGAEFSNSTAPVAPTPGTELLATAGAGTAAVLADWAAFRWRAPLVALLPGLVAFVGCAVAGVGPGRAWVVAAEVGGAALFLLAEQLGRYRREVWFSGSRTEVSAWAVRVGVVGAALAVLSAVAVTPVLARRDGVGALGWRTGSGNGGGERIVPNPIVSLRTRLVQLSNTPVFAVSSPVPSYWRLTSLDHFNGTTWTSTGSYRDVSGRLPGAPDTSTIRTVQASFRIQQLDSVWLPQQFNPIAIHGVNGVSYDEGSGSLLTARSTSNGLSYSVTSFQYLDTLSAADLRSAPSFPITESLPADLELPAIVDGPITNLAERITAGQATEYGKAIAIQDYLRGPGFSYTLDPLSDGSDAQALYNFLFVTRQGYCQQFAGAYAVLARAAGLPTRLAVGFATGQGLAGGGFQVHDADAHTWPEVYFGPRFGWLPFEPTPGFSVPGTSGYSGTSAGMPNSSQPTTSTTVPTTAPTSVPTVRKPSASKGAASSPTTAAPGSRHGGAGAGWWLLLLPAALAAVASWAALNVGLRQLMRRRRRSLAARRGPASVVVNEWSDVTAEMGWLGIGRHPAETDDEFAARADLFLRRAGIGDRWSGTGPVGLAAMARRATFAPSLPAGDADEAVAAGDEIRRRLRRWGTGRDRLRRSLLPAPRARSILGRGLHPH